MASSIIGALRAVLGLDTAQFEAGADRAKAKAGGLKAALMSTAASLTPVAAGAVAATIAVNGFAIGMKLAADAAQYADDISAQAYKLGVSAEYLQAFSHAAEATDVPAEEAAKALEGLSAAIGALQSGIGDGKIRKALEGLGISQDQIDSFKSVEDALPVIADKIAGLGTITEQLQFAKKFGIEALLPLLKQGSDGIQQLMTDARDLGVVLSEDVVQHLADMNEQMRVADERARIAGLTLGASLTPAMVKVKEATVDLFNWLGRVIDRFNKLENRSLQTLGEQRGKLFRELHEAEQLSALPGFKTYIAFLKRKIDENDAAIGALRSRQQEPAAAAGDAPASSSSGGGKSSRAKSSSRDGSGVSLDTSTVTVDPDTVGSIYHLPDMSRQQDDLAKGTGLAVLEGVLEGINAAKAEFSNQIYSATRNGLEALRYGGFKGFGEWLADSFARAMDDRLAKSLAKMLDGGNVGGGAMGFLRSLAGFDSGGSFQVGGVGGTDSQLRLLRLSPQENVSITRGNDVGGRVVQVIVNPSRYFDAAVTDVAAPIAVNAGVAASEVGAAKAQAADGKRRRYQISR